MGACANKERDTPNIERLLSKEKRGWCQ